MNVNAEALEPAPGQQCRNCGQPRLGQHCHGCGQRYGEERLGFRLLQRWLIGHFLEVDRGLLLTVRELTLRPGRTIRSYVQGQRQRYTNPFTYLFLWVGLSVLVWSVLGHGFEAQMKDEVTRAATRVSPALHFSAAQAERCAEIHLALVPYSRQLLLSMCLPLVAMLRLLFRRSGYNLAEHSVFTLFGVAQVSLLGALLYAGLFLAHAPYHVVTSVPLVTFPLVFITAGMGFYGGRLGTALKIAFALAASFWLYAALEWLAIVVWVARA